MRHVLFRYLHLLAGLGIAAGARRAVARERGCARVPCRAASSPPPPFGRAPLPRAGAPAFFLGAGDEGGERVALELFDADGDALALDVDRQPPRLDFLAFLEVLDRF